MINKLRTWTLILLAASLAGCDGGAPGADAGDNDGGADAQVETVAPAVTGTIPRDGDTEVNPDTSIRIVFSEPVDPASGTLAVSAGESQHDVGAPSASADGRELTFTLSSPLPGNASVEVVVDGYRDLAGNAMAAEHAFSFSTSDPFAPTVVSATPAEGATGATPSTLEIEFSEVMNATLGVVELEGGPGTIGGATWDGARVSYPISGLAPSTAYRVVLSGFADPAGNAFDGEPYLGDGALDFTTAADTTAPVVLESTPTEGQADVPPTRTTRVRVVFSEPMDPAAGTATLVSGTSSTELEASWAGGDTILLLDVSGLLEEGIDYRVELTGFTDASGNALDGAPYLGDGALDFHTDVDELPPFVLYTNPAQGGSGVRWTTQSLYVTFSEGMDPSITEVPYTDGVSSGTFTGTWSSAGTLLDIDVAGKLISGRSYELDFSAFRDAEGTALDVAHPYLGDAKLRFTTATPRGENCQDFLTNAEATVSGAVHTWTIDADQANNVDGAAPCDRSGGSADAVVRYTKTSPDSTDAGGAGRVLRVTVTSRSTVTDKTINVDVLRDACDPTSSVVERLFCGTGANPHTFDLDVPAGEYFVWVAASAATFRGATVEIEEIPAGRGDTCRNAIPLTPGATNTVSAAGARSLHAPSCTGDAALTWYRFTARQGLTILKTNAASIGAVVDPVSGGEVRCGDDTQTSGLAVFADAGSDVCVALSSNEAISSITLDQESPYTGVRGQLTRIPVNKPSGVGSYFDGWMAVQGATLYRGQSSPISVPITGGDVSSVAFPAGTTRYGGGAVTRPDGIYVTRSTTEPTGSRLLRVTDPTGVLLETPVEVDVLPAGFEYPNRRFDALTFDGTSFLTATAQHTTSQTDPDCCTTVTFWSIPAAGGAPVQIGANDFIDDVSALAADATFLYVYGRSGTHEAIWRLRRDQLADPAQLPVELFSGYELSDNNGALYVDSTTNAGALYLRTYIRSSGSGIRHSADVWLIVEPDEPTPAWMGPLWVAGGNRPDSGMAYDPAGPTLWVFDTTGNTTHGNWFRID